jgi:hypothetical protein
VTERRDDTVGSLHKGDVFGDGTLIAGPSADRPIQWRCECLCGRQLLFLESRLLAGEQPYCRSCSSRADGRAGIFARLRRETDVAKKDAQRRLHWTPTERCVLCDEPVPRRRNFTCSEDCVGTRILNRYEHTNLKVTRGLVWNVTAVLEAADGHALAEALTGLRWVMGGNRRPQPLPRRSPNSLNKREADDAADDKRTGEVVALAQQGLTLREIGDRYGIMGNRVRRILIRAGIPSIKVLRNLRQERERQRRAEKDRLERSTEDPPMEESDVPVVDREQTVEVPDE